MQKTLESKISVHLLKKTSEWKPLRNIDIGLLFLSRSATYETISILCLQVNDGIARRYIFPYFLREVVAGELGTEGVSLNCQEHGCSARLFWLLLVSCRHNQLQLNKYVNFTTLQDPK